MAKLMITLTDVGNGLMVRLTSDEPLPKDGEQGTIAQELGLIGLELIRQEFKQASGLELKAQIIH